VRVETLVQSCLQKHDLPAAATVAIKELGPNVVRYLRAMLRNEEDVADTFSDWAESLWSGIGTFEGRSSFRTWAFRLAFTSAMHVCDRAHRKRERRFATGEASGLAQEIRTATAIVNERRRQGLAELRSELAPEEQTLLFLRVEQELPWEEIAAVLSQAAPVDPATVRKRYERLKEKLRKLARDRGLVE
jgi:RNA polymerase sigma-70 factor (ECF subfamily)